eukprot:CAMPEP_0206250096 /NCGR_PEP_ID=MMETSP0047_2-20121206/21278_1 /ASSEMBLY_ACC=CAM_ASM_000192 /TAXON_ID=195065 /ORGANISM="Chroomonas mesostigmatica_cf, Strain CCMP1168" /LENGTH=240 /DNA_ID=CAMNT_0053675899 /DNA_START=32 /DNA_END=750 /DNA_ORIENTATION=-
MRLRGAGTPALSLKAVSQITCGVTALSGATAWLIPDETARTYGLPRDLTVLERAAHIGLGAHNLAIAAITYFAARGEPIHVGVGWSSFVLSFFWMLLAFHKGLGASAVNIPKEPALWMAAAEGLLSFLALNEGCGEMDIDNVVLAAGLFKLVLSAGALLNPAWFLGKLGVSNPSPFAHFMLHDTAVLGLSAAAFTLLYDDIPAHAVALGLTIGAAGCAYNALSRRDIKIGAKSPVPFVAA